MGLNSGKSIKIDNRAEKYFMLGVKDSTLSNDTSFCGLTYLHVWRYINKVMWFLLSLREEVSKGSEGGWGWGWVLERSN